ncbi:MAG: methyltransferase domain-containing protein, partial [bacterium]
MTKKMFNFSFGSTNDSERENWVKNTLKKIPAGNKILDAGAGERRYEVHCPHLKYVAQDFGKYDGSGDGSGLQTNTWDQSKLDIMCDIVDIPVESNSFDAVMCIEVFEHIPDPISAIKEFTRIIKPGGHLIITAPFACGTHFAPYIFYSGFTKYFYETHLSKDFEILEIKANGNFFEYLAQELRRMPSIAKKYTNSIFFRILYKILVLPIIYILWR